jgi:plasmid stabilization system protein ParE
MSVYALTPFAKTNIFDIWSYIADDSEDAADRVEQAIYDACAFMAEAPMRGRSRPRPDNPFGSFLDADALSQLHRCVPARDGPHLGCRSSARKEKYTAHPETALVTVLRGRGSALRRFASAATHIIIAINVWTIIGDRRKLNFAKDLAAFSGWYHSMNFPDGKIIEGTHRLQYCGSDMPTLACPRTLMASGLSTLEFGTAGLALKWKGMAPPKRLLISLR